MPTTVKTPNPDLLKLASAMKALIDADDARIAAGVVVYPRFLLVERERI